MRIEVKGRKMGRRYLLLVGCLIGQQVMALDISDAELQEKGIAAEVEGGFSMTTGNSDTTSWRSRAAVDYYLDNWRHGVELKLDYAEDDDETSEESYFASYQLDRKYGELNYTYGLTSYENDRFAGLRDLYTISLGYGHIFTPHKRGTLKLEAGPGYRTAQDSDSETIFRGNSEYEWTISEYSSFSQKLNTEIADDNSISRAESVLTARINGSLAMKLSFSVTHQSNPTDEDGEEKDSTDTKTALTLLYKI